MPRSSQGGRTAGESGGGAFQGEPFVVDGGEMFRPTYDFTIEQYEGIKKAR